MLEREQREDKKKKRLLLLLIIVIAMGVTIWALFFRVTTLTPDYAPRQEELYAEDLGDGNGSKLEQAEGGGAVSITYTTNVDVDLSEKLASLYFANPFKPNQNMVLQIVVQDTVVAQSVTIMPGKKIEKNEAIEYRS